uniref:Uncharacterized protein n=1 Tax=Clastoptera arizonana TaxID=38151 RepID=A0A1B6CYW2_9HEMI
MVLIMEYFCLNYYSARYLKKWFLFLQNLVILSWTSHHTCSILLVFGMFNLIWPLCWNRQNSWNDLQGNAYNLQTLNSYMPSSNHLLLWFLVVPTVEEPHERN